MAELRHSIQSVAEQTGLSPHVIRVWERRYGTVQPVRSDGNQRRYSESDVHRLRLLHQITRSGHSIGTVAHLNLDQLISLADQLSPAEAAPSALHEPPSAPGSASLKDSRSELLAAAYDAVVAMDPIGLESVLDRGAVELGVTSLLIQVVAPLVERIGEGWQSGSLQIAHEHIASAVLRTQLGFLSRPISLHPTAPVLLTSTPAGQIHELGAVLAGALASTRGWRVVYAGPSLPAAEIASAAQRNAAAVVALSVVHPGDDPHLPVELSRLRRMLPAAIPLIVGGRAASAYAGALEGMGIVCVHSLEAWMNHLNRLRQPPS